MWFWIRCHFPISTFLKLGTARLYYITKGNIYFCVLFLLFFKWALSTRADNCRLSPELRQVYSILSLVVFLSFVRFLLNVERVRFVFRMRNASPLSHVKSVHGPARLLPSVELIWANFSAVAPMLTKIEAWLTRNPLKCGIKIIPQILKVLLTKPYKRLWKNQTRF